MARGTRLVTEFLRLEREIDLSLERDGGGGRRERRLYRELWEVLTLGASFSEVSACSSGAARSGKWIERHLKQDREHAVGKALLEHMEFGASTKAVCEFWGVRKSEWAYLRHLAGAMGERIARGVQRRPWPEQWQAEVEGHHEEMDVFVSDQALEDMLLGAWEAYFVPVPGKPRSRRREVYGLCFGSVREQKRTEKGEGKRRILSIHIRRVAMQLRARSGRGFVEPNRRSEEEHLRMAQKLFPHLQLVGDFHSHPYDSLGELRRNRGWDYSREDEKANQGWCARLRALKDRNYRPRLALILALAEGERAGRGARAPEANVLPTTFGRCQGYLGAYRIRPDGSYARDWIALHRPAISTLGA